MIAVNVAIELMGSAVSIILLVSLLVNGDMQSKEGRIFGTVVGLQLFILLGDALSWAITNWTQPWTYPVTVITNFFSFFAGVFAPLLFAEYLLACASARQKVSRTPAHVMLAVCCVLEGMVVLSLLNGMVFDILPDNTYVVGPLYWLFSIFFTLAYVLLGALALRYRESLDKTDAYTFLVFVGMMGIVHWLEPFVGDIMITYAVSVLGTLMIYVNIQAKKSRQLALDMAETRVAVMLSQIQPHFLYNALVAIERLCVKDPQQAQAAVASFSTYLRGNLDSLSQREPIAFAKELEHVQNYLSLERRRFGERLRVVYDIQADQFFLPALTLQTLVENAVQHGVTQRLEGGTVWIRSREAAAGWDISVEDDGVGFDPIALAAGSEGSHIGLLNVQNRLAAMCQGTLRVQSEPDGGTQVHLYIPREEAKDAYHRRG